MKVSKIISGGQTGADRGGLDAAIELGIPHGGWCPARRRAEDGRIPGHYQLRETCSTGYQERTIANVMAANATLIVTLDDRPLSGGTLLTFNVARSRQLGLVLHVATTSTAPELAHDWLSKHDVFRLNVAGPRESKEPGIQAATMAFLLEVLR